MPITIRHQAGAGLIGAYAAGQASSRRRAQKYAMDRLLLQQRHQQRLEEIGLGRGIRAGAIGRGVRGRALGPVQGRINDPLAKNPLQQGANPLLTERERRAALRGRARKYRLGGGIPAEWQPTFTPQAEIEREQELADEARKFQRQDRIRAEEWEREGRLRAAEGEQRLEAEDRRFGRTTIDEFIPDIPDHLTGTPFENELKKLNDAERILRMGRDFDPNDPDVQEKIAEIQAERERIREMAPPKRPSDERLREFLGDNNFNQYGHLPWVPDDKGGFVIADIPEDRAATATAASKEKLTTRLVALKKEWRTLKGSDDPNAEAIGDLEDEIEKVETELKGLDAGSVAPQEPPTAPGTPSRATAAFNRAWEQARPGESILGPDGQIHVKPSPPEYEAQRHRRLVEQSQAHIAAFNKAWKQLDPGQTLLGPDGRPYTKRK